jgi:MFS transporter, FSR family, fosmidomycin resistance protein
MFRIYAILFSIHALGDFYALIYPPMLPHLQSRFNLSVGQMATLATVALTVPNYLQPVVGWLSERFGRRLFLGLGLCFAAIGMSFIGLSPNVATVVVLLVIGKMGIAFFHPCGAALAGDMAREHRGTGMFFYMLGGYAGCVVAPFLIPILMGWRVDSVAWLAIVGIVFGGILLLPRKQRSQEHSTKTRVHQPLMQTLKQLWPIHLLVFLRFIPYNAFAYFIPVYATQMGMTRVQGGQVLAGLMFAGALGMTAANLLEKVFSRRLLILVSNVGGGLFWLWAMHLTGAAFVAAICAGSFFGFLVMPLLVVAAQERVPQAKSTASGIVMGFAYGNAALCLIPLGWYGSAVEAATDSKLVAVNMMLQCAALALFAAAIVGMVVRMGTASAK